MAVIDPITGKPSYNTEPDLYELYQKDSSGALVKINIALTQEAVLKSVYPVGSIYMSVNSTSPASLFGGTWQQLKDRFLLGTSNLYPNGATGGAENVTLTIDQIPSHGHYTRGVGGGYGTETMGSSPTYLWQNYTYYVDAIMNTGGGKSHNNMPPYLAVYMWKRTA